jgi:hypothetical protein
LRWQRSRQDDEKEPAQETYFDVDLITSLALASRGELRCRDVVEGVIALKKAVPFEMRDYRDRILSTNAEIRGAVEELLAEGVHEGWIEAVTMTYADRHRRDVPLRLRELLADRPSLKETLDRILVHIGSSPHP